MSTHDVVLGTVALRTPGLDLLNQSRVRGKGGAPTLGNQMKGGQGSYFKHTDIFTELRSSCFSPTGPL